MTAIEIANTALGRMGCNPIASFDDATSEAITMKSQYAAARDYVLEDREWTFAKGRALLNQDPVAPLFGFAYQYIIAAPVSIIRVVRVWQDSAAELIVPDWIREGSHVLSNYTSSSPGGPLYAEVLQRVDESTFSPGMVQALVELLIHFTAVPLTENIKRETQALVNYEAKVKIASAMDGSQGRAQQLRPPPLPGRISHDIR